MGWSVADQGIISLTNFGLTLAIGRAAAPDDFSLVIIVVNVLLLTQTALQTPLVLTPFMFLAGKESEAELPAYVRHTAIANVALGVVTSLVLLIASAGLDLVDQPAYASATRLAAFPALLMSIRYFIRTFHMMTSRFDRAFVTDSTVGVALGLGLLFLHHSGNVTPSATAFVIALSEVAAVLMTVVVYRPTIARGVAEMIGDVRAGLVSAVRPSARKNWEFGKWLVGSWVLDYLLIRAQFLLLPLLLSLSSLAEYQASFLLLQPMFFLSTGIEVFAWNRGAAIQRSEGTAAMTKLLAKLATGLSATVATYTLIAALFAEPAVRLMFAAKFKALTPAIWFFGAAMLFGAWGKMLSAAMMAIGKTIALTTSNAIGVFVSLSLMVALTPSLGPVGAAAGYSAGILAVACSRALYWHFRVLRPGQPVET